MKYRVVMIGALAAAIPVLLLAPALIAGQSGGQPPSAASTLKTPWGAPDLQGIWSNEHVIPFERPTEYGTRQFLTDQELAAKDKELAARPIRSLYRDTRKEAGTEQDVAGAYNSVWQADRPTKTGKRTSQVIDPPDGRIPPMTPEAQQRIAAQREYLEDLLQGSSGGRPGPPSLRKNQPPPEYNLDRMNRADGPEDRAGGERCFGGNIPAIGALQRIVQSPDSVEITGGFSRVIPISDRPHLPPNVRQFYGDARGRWEGNTLVVDVTNFTQRSNFRGSRENLHVIERFTRTDANTLTYQVTVEDPTTWTRPWTAIIDLTKNPDKPNMVFEQACHEGNYGLLGMLANTRAAEKLFKEGKGKDPALMDLATGGAGE